MTTLNPRECIVFALVGYQSPYWWTADGKSLYSAATLEALAEELRRVGRVTLYALPTAGAPANAANLGAEEWQDLTALIQFQR